MTFFYPVLFLVVFAGAVAQGVSGFAFSMIVLAVLPHFLSYTDALALTSFLTIFLLMCNAWHYRHFIVWKWLPVPIASYFVFTLLSVRLLSHTAEAAIWYKLLGIIFILMALYMNFFQNKIKIRPTWQNGVLFCGAGGFISGLFGVGGPPVVLYFLAIADDKNQYMSSLQMAFLIMTLLDFSTRMGNGMVTWELVYNGLLSIWCVILGLFVGNLLFRRMNEQLLRKIIYSIMLLNGVYLCFFR